MQELNIKNYAHIGDAVYEVFIRERTILLTSNLKKLHQYTVHFVNASFQTELLEKITSLIEEKKFSLFFSYQQPKPIQSQQQSMHIMPAHTSQIEQPPTVLPPYLRLSKPCALFLSLAAALLYSSFCGSSEQAVS